MKWLWRLLGGPADRPVKGSEEFFRPPVKTGERKTASAETGAPKIGGAKSTERKIASSTVTLPPTAAKPDLSQLAAKYAKDGAKKNRRHDKHRRGRPNGVSPGRH